MIKAIFRLLWPICFIELANLLGFNSSRAQAACQNASDHHKSWQIFEIFLFATTEELLLPYVRQNLSSGSSPSVQGYHSWLAGVVDPNYKFMAEIVFSCSFALHLFRAGVRRNNSAVIQCAKNKFACLFFGLGMPNYMETYIRDSFVRLQCPAPVLAFIEDNESYSISGSPNKGEGGDFILENVNRRIKMCIPPGLPDKRRWKNACRNVDRLQKIKDHLHKSSAHTSYEFSYNISQEISSFRSALRSKNYFHTPFIYKEHTSLSGNVLDSQLVNIRNTCNSNFDTFLQHIIINGIHSRKKLNTIIITHEDRNNHKLKTKAELITLIQHKLNSCTSQEIQCKWSYIKRSNKGKLLQFLEEILIMEEGDEATEAEDS